MSCISVVWKFVKTCKTDFGIGVQEAYDEFKRVLLALMYDKDDESSPIAEEVLLLYFIQKQNSDSVMNAGGSL